MPYYPSYMRKWGALAIGGVLLISLATPVNAAAPKAGATCTKKNATATSAGKLYTCILSGKKLVWNKGVAIPKKSEESTGEVGRAESNNSIMNDSRITPISDLTSIDICKTTDLTPDYSRSGLKFLKNGFPRPMQSLAGKKTARVLVIPFSFKDLQFRVEKYQSGKDLISDYDTLIDVIPKVEGAFKELSLGRFELKIDVLPKAQWWQFEQTHPFTSTWGVDNFGKFVSIFETSKPEFKFTGYDGYVFLGGHGDNGTRGFGSAQGAIAEKVTNSPEGYLNGVFMLGGFGDAAIWAHELGHALFAFEDLYLFSQPLNQRTGLENVPLMWDLMADANKLQLLEWNRLLMGWLTGSEIRCLSDQKSTVHYLSEYNTSKDPKLLTINLAPGVTLAAEPRNSYNSVKGLLLYTINTYVPHGQGPIIAQSVLVEKGQTKSLFGWDFSVLETNSTGLLVSVVKTDKDKFDPPIQTPAAPPPQPQTAKITLSKGEVVSIASQTVKATWEVQGHQSYRVYVTASDDFQKVYFESGYVNDSRNPIVLQIQNLPCNRELRTMAEFFSEKDGKGERLVVENKQLTSSWCEASNKKP